MSGHKAHDPRHAMTCGECGREWCGLCEPTPADRCPFEYDHEETYHRPTLVEEAERLLSYWEQHEGNPEAVEKWAIQDLFGICRYIVEEEA